MKQRKFTELTTAEGVRAAKGDLRRTVVKHADLRAIESTYWATVALEWTYFFGCVLDPKSDEVLRQRGAVVFDALPELLYQPFRTSLYSIDELLAPIASGATLDRAIYLDFVEKGGPSTDVVEAIARRLHDDGIDDGVEVLLRTKEAIRCVGIMGGSSALRTDPWYARVAQLARLLTRAGYFVITGGGPGMMEAANLGAYMAPFSDDTLHDALALLQTAPAPTDACYVERALEVRHHFKDGADNLGIPTWFYGHEPTNAFAVSIAKYFENSIREAGLIALAKGGVVFCPGSAGTRQEIFMDAAQNHYATNGVVSPMVFFGRGAFEQIFTLVCAVANDECQSFLSLTDEPVEALTFLQTHPPHEHPSPALPVQIPCPAALA